MKKNAKFIIALVTAGLTGIVSVLPVGSAATQYINFALVVLGAVTVYFVPNAETSRRA